VCPVRVAPCVVGAGHAALFSHRLGLPLVARDTGDLITFHLAGERRRGLLDHHALASLAGHLMHVVLLEIACLGHVVVREGEPHAIQAQYPHPQGLMRPGKDRVRPSVKTSLAGLAQGALTLGVGVVASLLRDRKTLTTWTTDAVWPAEGADGLKTFGIVNE
jgi:hypothetical protein